MEPFNSHDSSVTVEIAPGPADTYDVTFRATDVPGTLAAFAGTLTVNGLDIVSAVIGRSNEGTLTDSFGVVPRAGRTLNEQDAAVLARCAVDVLSGSRDIERELREIRATFVAGEGIETKVEVNTQSEMSTGVDISCPDRPGLLYDMASALVTHRAQTRAISVLGFNRKARVSFRLVNQEGKPFHPGDLDALRIDLMTCCSR